MVGVDDLIDSNYGGAGYLCLAHLLEYSGYASRDRLIDKLIEVGCAES